MSLKKITPLLVLITVLLAVAALANVKVGDEFPDLKSFKIEGKYPEDWKGKVVMVDFWASWCGPCGESFPAMDELQKKYGEKGFVIIAVNVDENKSDMADFLKTHQVSFTIVRDANQKLVEKAGIGSMPSSFILGPDGKVKFAHSGFHGAETKKQYEKEIESLLTK